MSTTAPAQNFHPCHAVTAVFQKHDAAGIYYLPETGPASAGMKLPVGIEQICTATDALINTFDVMIPVLTTEGVLRPFLPGDKELFGSQLSPPFLFGFKYFEFQL